MNITGTSVVPDQAERAHLRLCGIVLLETMACFAAPAASIVAGAIFSPYLIASALLRPGLGWRPLAMFVLGSTGLYGVGRLMHLLWNRPAVDTRPWLTLSAVACGCTASLLIGVAIWTGDAPGGHEVLVLIVYLPFACTAHLLFLNRHALFRGSPRPPHPACPTN